MFYLVLAISRKSFLLLPISDNTEAERYRRGFVWSLFAQSRNSTGQVLEQLDLFVIALSGGLAQMIPRGLFQPKLFYDSLVFIFCLYTTCSLSRSDRIWNGSVRARAWAMFNTHGRVWITTELGLHLCTHLSAYLDGIFGPHTEPTVNNTLRFFSPNL